MIQSIRLRLLLLALAGIAIALAVAAAGLTTLFGRHVERRIGHELDAQIGQLAGNLRIAPDGTMSIAREPGDPRFTRPMSGLYWQVLDEADGALRRSRSLWDSSLALPQDPLRAGAVHEHSVTGPDGETLILHEMRVVIAGPGGDRPVRISVAMNRSELDPLMSGFARDLLPGLAILGAVLLAGAWLQVGAGLRPLARVRAGLQRVGEGKARRLEAAVPREIAPMVSGINGLLDMRDQSVARARDRAADLAHGLKTPLMALAGDAARLRSRGDTETADDIEQLAAQMRRTIDRELARSRLRHRGELAQAIPLRPVCEAVARTLARTPHGEGRSFQIEVAEGTTTAVLPEDLHDLIGNLMENAAKAARSVVRVTARPADAGTGFLTIAVVDDGDEADPVSMVALVERGRRAEQSEGGAGLGLAIVSDILSAYGAGLTFERSPLGGLAVGFSLPGARPGAA